jgi:hypothetical protein
VNIFDDLFDLLTIKKAYGAKFGCIITVFLPRFNDGNNLCSLPSLGENASIQTAVIHRSEIFGEDLDDTFIHVVCYPIDMRRIP